MSTELKTERGAAQEVQAGGKEPPQPEPAHPPCAVRKRPLQASEFLAIVDAGIFGPGDKIELINGEMITMAPPSGDHSDAVSELLCAFASLFGKRCIPRCEALVRLVGEQVVMPDLALLPLEWRGKRGIPGASDVLLLIEVSKSSLQYDQHTKRPLYAKAGIREYWIINLERHVLEVYRTPVQTEGRYEEVRTFRPGEEIALQALPDATFPVASLLPKP